MKFLALLALTTLAAAIPAAEPAEHGHFPQLVERKACYHASDCSWFYAAKCEHYWYVLTYRTTMPFTKVVEAKSRKAD